MTYVGATLLEKGAPFADFAGRSSATTHDWDTGCSNEKGLHNVVKEVLT